MSRISLERMGLVDATLVQILQEKGALSSFQAQEELGLKTCDWAPATLRRFFSELGDSGYRGPACVEVEDRAYEGALETRKAALLQCRRFLSQFTE